MTQHAYNDEQSNQPPEKTELNIWDDRPRFLGMFSSYAVPPESKVVRLVGFANHMVTCMNCIRHGQVHPKPLVSLVYVRVGKRIYTASWPTWLVF